ncbi:MAG TPA: cell division protein SepF [Candidatus Ornithomonoglobus intestinigallinarum]|uniref:Cell division protein SepF n=1 Tax=Candidatus Ornithomonoglobus intestinigallinarum TaxID=2840894 RepID=A0A9D1H1N9_9FIRM|nr:cell division protein SepF [Candidatus Ornithomonoglobus intestinigallinarum]
MGFISAVKNFMGFDDAYDDYEEEDRYEDEQEEEEPRARRRRTSKVIPITARNEDANVQIIKPATFDDARKASEVLMRDQVVVFDVTGMRDSEEALRVVDFVSGTVFGLRGNIRKINTGIFIAAPRHIDISGDNIKEHTRNNFDWR